MVKAIELTVSRPAENDIIAIEKAALHTRVAGITNLDLLVQGAHHLLAAGELEYATVYLDQARAISPTNRDANALYAWLQLSRYNQSPNQPILLAQAAAAAETAWQADPTNLFAQELRETTRTLNQEQP